MKEELEQIANKHNIELKEVVEVARELIDKIEEEMEVYRYGDMVLTKYGKGEIKNIFDIIMEDGKTLKGFTVEVYINTGGYLGPVYEKMLVMCDEREVEKCKE